MADTRDQLLIPVDHAVAIVVPASAIGGAVGYLCTVHLVETVASDLEAVWLTTVVFAAIALYLWGYLRT